MSVLASDIKWYCSANMPETDTTTSGGAIDTQVKPTFVDIAPAGNLQIVSSDAGDTSQTVTITGRRASGVEISEVKTLNGQTPVPMTTETGWDRILKAVKSATTTGDVAVEAATAERDNTAQGGADATASEMAYITLDASASAVDDAYNGMVVRIDGGTGSGQIRQILDYEGSSKKAWVNRDWGTTPDNTSTFVVSEGTVFDKSPAEIMTVRRIMYKAEAEAAGGSAKDLYEKVFCKNTHATLALLGASITEEADAEGQFTFGLAASKDDSGSVSNRVTDPGVTFDSLEKNVPGTDLEAGEAIGIWFDLNLPAGDPATDTTVEMGANGTST